MVQHPRVSWVECQQVQPGVFVCRCSVCGEQMGAPAGAHGADGFALSHAQHGPAPTHYGAGDLVAKMTGALGIKPCSPCEARRRALNGLLPNVWRR